MAQESNASKPRRDDDLTDSESDQQRLQQEVTYIDLPDVSDIPGQEHITVPPLGELADITISSDDEEGIVNDDSDAGDFFFESSEEDDTAGIP